VTRAALTTLPPCAACDTARSAEAYARSVSGWRDGRHQLAVLAAGVTVVPH